VPSPDVARGVAEVRIDPGSLQSVDITRMTVEVDGVARDLGLNPSTGTFNSSLFLPVGPHTLVGRAFSSDDLVGESNPVPVQITTASVTRVELRVLDLTGGGPRRYGPLFDSLTFPTSVQAQQSASFVISVFAPGGAPVSYEWTSDCADSVFSTTSAATTAWSKPTAGSCTIQVTATSDGFSLSRAFSIVVFPPGSGDGAADITGTFIAAPQMSMSFSDLACSVSPGSNESCPATVAAPTVALFSVFTFNWGGSTPGPFAVSDNCGGAFGDDVTQPDSLFRFWLPPVAGGLCIITVRATSADGVAGVVTAALVTLPGTAPPVPPAPTVAVAVDGCHLNTVGTQTDCGAVPAGATRTLTGFVQVRGGHAGHITLTDSCVGAVPVLAPSFSSTSASWTVPSVPPGTTCTTTLRATTLEGSSTDAVGVYHVQ
jgi:hypothetical protein